MLTKKDVPRESCKFSFTWGQNEDCCPGDSISHGSEELLQRGSGGRSIYTILVTGDFDAIKHSFYKRVSISHKELSS